MLPDAFSVPDGGSSASLGSLPVEILQKIYEASDDLDAVLSLSSVNHKFRSAYNGSRKLVIIEKVLEAQYGPLYEAIQLVTYNEANPAHLPRKPNMSIAMAGELVVVGRTVNKWEALYPTIKWRGNSEFRRRLRAHEQYKFRRAMYRIWLYNRAFDGSSCQPKNVTRGNRAFGVGDPRATFCRQLSNTELGEMTDLWDTLLDMIRHDIIPTNGMVQNGYAICFQEHVEPLDFRNYELDYYCPVEEKLSFVQKLAAEGWDGYEAVKLSSKIQKLTPDVLLLLREVLQTKRQRRLFLDNLPYGFRQFDSSFSRATDALSADRDCDFSAAGGIVDELM